MNPFILKLKKDLSADKKKVFIAGGLLVVAGVLWARMYFTGDVPKPAPAKASNPAPVGDSPITAAPKRTGPRQVVHLDLPDTAARNLFNLKNNPFVQVEIVNVKEPPNPPVKQVDEPVQKVKGLVLQGTITGPNAHAVINGEVVKIGETIEGFTLKHVGPQEVVLERDGKEIRLTK